MLQKLKIGCDLLHGAHSCVFLHLASTPISVLLSGRQFLQVELDQTLAKDCWCSPAELILWGTLRPRWAEG